MPRIDPKHALILKVHKEVRELRELRRIQEITVEEYCRAIVELSLLYVREGLLHAAVHLLKGLPQYYFINQHCDDMEQNDQYRRICEEVADGIRDFLTNQDGLPPINMRPGDA